MTLPEAEFIANEFDKFTFVESAVTRKQGSVHRAIRRPTPKRPSRRPLSRMVNACSCHR
jgi:hypothetical protein